MSTRHILRVAVSFEDLTPDSFDGVLLDLDDTLYRYAPCHDAALHACFEHYGFNLPWRDFRQSYRKARNEVTKLLAPQAACRSRLFAFQTMAEHANITNPYTLAYTLDEIYWSSFIEVMVPDPSAVDFLIRCDKLQIPTCIVTDMTAQIQIRKIERLGLGPYITQIVTSEEVGAEKPDRRMFEKAACKLGKDITRCIMIGDSAHKDIDGALDLGMKAYLISLNERDSID